MTDMPILALTGSLRQGSHNTALLRAAQSLAPQGMNLELADLRGVPLYDGDAEAASGKPESVTALDQRIRAARGLIIATPEYNFSTPGVLKNGIDWLSRGDNPFKAKRLGIIGASTGPMGTARSQYHLRQTLQGLSALTMPRPEVFVAQAQTKFDAQGALTDDPTIKVLKTWLAAFQEWIEG